MTQPSAPAPFDARAFLRTLTPLPGVYRMLDVEGQVLYVGKARNLKRRVASYFRKTVDSAKTRALVAQIAGVEVTVTHTEAEALLLEHTLIQRFRPRYNILLRDDKSYPYLLLTAHPYPRLLIHRGPRRAAGRYFGPYPSATAVRETLTLLQRVFRLRQCEDGFFAHRSRPCLQYQIRRCSGPCTEMIGRAEYAADVADVVAFLEGRSGELIDALVARMEVAAGHWRYEEAAQLRDRIAMLRQVQERQYVSAAEGGDLDVVAVAIEGGAACVQVFFFREGRSLGNKPFYPRMPEEQTPGQVLSAFLVQYYLNHPPPAEILLSHEPDEAAVVAEALGERAGRKVQLSMRVRGERARWLEMANRNAALALAADIASRAGVRRRFEALQDALGLDAAIERMECFDISHTQGEATVASCVVFDGEGPRKSDYRRYNIEGITPGDDYAAMHQALTRRYTRLRDEDAPLPDLLFIDGGRGQLAQAEQVLAELGIDGVHLIGIAKGPDRRPGLEVLHLSGQDRPLTLPAESAALHLVQQIRDEAHRFAITGHRQRRAQARRTSTLEAIPGIGPRRRQLLLKQFGGLQQLARAGVEDIAGVAGISKALAQRIYDAFHPDG
ncbi:MAG TPA: excinuclease ABC subunit UvrC [Plasticicumulans sp.]|uniref:excinuclease ABC subunit UvrC n=1 Tax=Plasticicumulans sp. TaxID=2307179 RepID=UPI002BE8A8DD|nr:excinuclease ABC subunit UvrC [Plasticicumulans sp.]MBS0602753.1 excinuclease ABC subunit UvrC [Pseudomonadota bacterium]HMW30652.1 excinuclease ABC subunit UvrC [Plasticicumulans sp.]HMW43327.1 excinuclease ABC subunit UvrC [Plasticicumulans sp.]HMX53619.1 excinuclease ABC subunit UvrC [Plasticicumulans sp.]HMZ11697.1 excinuclease ABC subunit UvrC [Plasticicumulans sp.]